MSQRKNGAGTLFIYSPELTRLPAQDRSFVIEPGLSNPRGLAWDSIEDQFLVMTGISLQIAALAPELIVAERIVERWRWLTARPASW